MVEPRWSNVCFRQISVLQSNILSFVGPYNNKFLHKNVICIYLMLTSLHINTINIHNDMAYIEVSMFICNYYELKWIPYVHDLKQHCFNSNDVNVSADLWIALRIATKFKYTLVYFMIAWLILVFGISIYRIVNNLILKLFRYLLKKNSHNGIFCIWFDFRIASVWQQKNINRRSVFPVRETCVRKKLL